MELDKSSRYVDFYTDYAFKRFFGTEANKDLLIDFLNQLFDGTEQIEDISYLPVEQVPAIAIERRAIFDIFCKSTDGSHFIVEMQNARQDYFKDRTLYYATFPIRSQAKKNDWDYQLKKVYSVNILNFNLKLTDDEKRWEEEYGTTDTRYLKVVKLTDVEKNTVFYDKLTFIYLEMPNFNKKLEECTSMFDKWLYAIKHLATLDNQPDELKSAIFNRLFELAEIAALNPNEYRGYEASLNSLRDYLATIKSQRREAHEEGHAEGFVEGHTKGREEGLAEGREEGLAEGIAEGMAKGREEGLAEGLAEGMAKGREEGAMTEKFANARRMKDLGLPADVIAKVSGLSLEEIENFW